MQQTSLTVSNAVLPKPVLRDIGNAAGYQKRDADIVDYQMWRVQSPETGLLLRGPRPASLKPKEYCVSLGAAYTFGRFAARPYPQLLGEALGISSLNLGFLSVGPTFYTDEQNKVLIDLVNRSKFATVAIFSGRSQGNSRFITTHSSQEQYILPDGRVVPANVAYQQLLDTVDKETVVDLISETRSRYVSEFSKLLDLIKVPKVLLWFSKREPHYEDAYDSLFGLFSSFPHLVNQSMVNALKLKCDAYVECADSTGLPHVLLNKETQAPVSMVRSPSDKQSDNQSDNQGERNGDSQGNKQGGSQPPVATLAYNNYYPSAEMHEAVTKRLVPVCENYL